MSICLFDNYEGYYTRRSVFGQKGDFITSPEVSQLFGEMIGVFVAHHIIQCKEPFSIVEYGPGRGTLACDLVRCLSKIPSVWPFFQKYVLVEKSNQLKILQAESLSKLIPRSLFEHAEESSHSNANLFSRNNNNFSSQGHHLQVVIANEFLDSLPCDAFHVTYKLSEYLLSRSMALQRHDVTAGVF